MCIRDRYYCKRCCTNFFLVVMMMNFNKGYVMITATCCRWWLRFQAVKLRNLRWKKVVVINARTTESCLSGGDVSYRSFTLDLMLVRWSSSTSSGRRSSFRHLTISWPRPITMTPTVPQWAGVSWERLTRCRRDSIIQLSCTAVTVALTR